MTTVLGFTRSWANKILVNFFFFCLFKILVLFCFTTKNLKNVIQSLGPHDLMRKNKLWKSNSSAVTIHVFYYLKTFIENILMYGVQNLQNADITEYMPAGSSSGGSGAKVSGGGTILPRAPTESAIKIFHQFRFYYVWRQ